jgi:flagellin-like protein
MKGVSEVIAIILILMITISLAGLAYMFMSTTMSDVTSSAGSTVDTTTSSMLTSFTIESMSSNVLYVRNTGQTTLSSLKVYVNDLEIASNITQASPAPGNVTPIALVGYIKQGDVVKVSSQSGVSATKVAPDQCLERGGVLAL